MEYLIVFVLTVWLIYWVATKKEDKSKGGVVDVLVDTPPPNYYISYDPASDSGNGSISLNSTPVRRVSLVVATPTVTLYNNGEVSTAKIQLDSDFYMPGDLIAIDGKLKLIIKSGAKKFMGHFYYIAVPVSKLSNEDFNFIKPGTKVFRLNRELIDSEKEYLFKNKPDVDAATTKFKDFNPPYKPHKYGGPASNTPYYKNSSDDILDDLITNPLLSPISPVSIWNSGVGDWDDNSFSSHNSPAQSDYDSSSSNNSSSSYDSSDSGSSSDCGGGDSGD